MKISCLPLRVRNCLFNFLKLRTFAFLMMNQNFIFGFLSRTDLSPWQKIRQLLLDKKLLNRSFLSWIVNINTETISPWNTVKKNQRTTHATKASSLTYPSCSSISQTKRSWLLFLLFTDLTQTPTNLKQRQAFQKEISILIGTSFMAYLN